MLSNQIYISQLSEKKWQQASEINYADLISIAVWRVNVLSFIAHLKDLQDILNPNETEKALRYKKESDRQTRIISKAVLKILLGRYTGSDPKEICFYKDENKKPHLDNSFFKEIQFNISHSGNWILIAISDSPIGIDIEQMNTSFTYQNILPFSFNLDEINYIQQSKIQHQSFYQLWTRKEALLKATGKGLVDDLAQVPSLDGIYQNPTVIQSTENWQITGFKVDENHVGSVAFNPVKTALQFFNFRL